jgi:hypothetical protein
MFKRLSIPLLLLLASTFFFPTNGLAQQQGSLVEDLFRTWAEARMKQNLPPSPVGPGQFAPGQPKPSQTKPSQLGPATVPAPRLPSPSGLPGTTAPQSSQVSTAWTTLSQNLNTITQDLRQTSSQQAGLRTLVPKSYQLSAQAENLRRMAMGPEAGRLQSFYPDFDRDYRQFSFELRSMPGVSQGCRDSIAQCDSLINRMGRHYSVVPQWNRERFTEIVIMAEVYLQTMIDDLQIGSLNQAQCRHLTHDLQMLVAHLQSLRPNLAVIGYDQIATEFNQFAARMTTLAREVREIHDPHLDRRLDRLRELADECYALLWMPAPIDQTSIVESAIRIETAIDELRDYLKSRPIRESPREIQQKIDELTRTIDRNAHRLVDEMKHHPDDPSIPGLLQPIDVASLELMQYLAPLPGLHHGYLATIRDETHRLLLAYRVPQAQNALNYDVLRSMASTLEGTSEYLKADLARYERYLTPASFRTSILRASDEFYRASRSFHEAVDERRNLDELVRRRTTLISTWQTLDAMMIDLPQHGLAVNRASSLFGYRDAIAEPIAGVAAMLGQ